MQFCFMGVVAVFNLLSSFALRMLLTAYRPLCNFVSWERLLFLSVEWLCLADVAFGSRGLLRLLSASCSLQDATACAVDFVGGMSGKLTQCLLLVTLMLRVARRR